MKHITGMGYEAIETLSGVEIYDGDAFICTLPGTLSKFEGEDGEIDDDALEDAIDNQVEIEKFLDDQSAYM